MITDTTDYSASATTSNTTMEMSEMQATAKSTVADLMKLTALVVTMASTNSGGGCGGRSDQKKKSATHKRKHCKHEVYHKDANCLNFEANKANRYASWKSVFAE